MSVIVIEAMSKRFGGVQAVAGISFEVNAGEVVALIGPNGAGKSTVVNLVTGLYRPDAGRILFDGDDVTLLPTHARACRGLGRTFQTPQAFPDLTLCENVAVAGPAPHRVGILRALLAPAWRARQATARRKSDELLALAGVSVSTTLPAGAASYGDQKRMELARALMLDPRVLLLDEPAAGLDPMETRQIGDAIRKVATERGVAVLLVEHDMKLVRAVADRLLVLDQGRLIAQGEPACVLSDPRVIAAYLGADTLDEPADLACVEGA